MKPPNVAAHRESVARAGRIGRRVGLGIYFLGLAYVVVVGFGTFIEGIFLTPPDAEMALAADISCETARADLATRLDAEAATFVSAGDRARLTRFLTVWDHQYGGIRTRCRDPRTRELEYVRHRVEIQLRRYERENGAALRRLGAAPTPSPAPESPR